MLRQLAASHPVMVTVEEGAIGGFAAHVLTFLTNEGLLDGGGLKFRSMTLPDRCVLLGAPCLCVSLQPVSVLSSLTGPCLPPFKSEEGHTRQQPASRALHGHARGPAGQVCIRIVQSPPPRFLNAGVHVLLQLHRARQPIGPAGGGGPVRCQRHRDRALAGGAPQRAQQLQQRALSVPASAPASAVQQCPIWQRAVSERRLPAA